MKIKVLFIFFALMLSYSYGGALDRILLNYFDNDGLGNYEFGFRSSDNIYRWQKGVLKFLGQQPFIDVTGGFAYIDELKKLRVTNFEANENGYQPVEGEGPGIPPRLATGSIG